MTSLYPWWQKAVFYQVFLPSFAGHKAWGNLPGESWSGGFQGLTAHLGYLQDLGIDAVEISPVSASFHWDDNAKTADDEYRISPEYGALKDFQEFVECAHQLKMRVVIDFFLDQVDYRSSQFSATHQQHIRKLTTSVVQALLDEARFWLDRGVDGFRLRGGRSRRIIQELRSVIDEYPKRILVGDIAYPFLRKAKTKEVFHLIYNSSFLHNSPRTPAWIASNQCRLLANLPKESFQAIGLGDFSASRLINRFCAGQNVPSENALEIARLYATLILTLRGTPFLYYGEEIGMTDLEQVQDNYLENVADQLKDPTSLLHFYRKLIRIRKSSPALSCGDYQSLVSDENCLVYLRHSPEQVCLVCINFSANLHNYDLGLEHANVEVLFSNWGREGEQGKVDQLSLAPYEIYIADLYSTPSPVKRNSSNKE